MSMNLWSRSVRSCVLEIMRLSGPKAVVSEKFTMRSQWTAKLSQGPILRWETGGSHTQMKQKTKNKKTITTTTTKPCLPLTFWRFSFSWLLFEFKRFEMGHRHQLHSLLASSIHRLGVGWHTGILTVRWQEQPTEKEGVHQMSFWMHLDHWVANELQRVVSIVAQENLSRNLKIRLGARTATFIAWDQKFSFSVNTPSALWRVIAKNVFCSYSQISTCAKKQLWTATSRFLCLPGKMNVSTGAQVQEWVQQLQTQRPRIGECWRHILWNCLHCTLGSFFPPGLCSWVRVIFLFPDCQQTWHVTDDFRGHQS